MTKLYLLNVIDKVVILAYILLVLMSIAVLIECIAFKKRINGIFVYVNRGIFFKNYIFQLLNMETRRRLKGLGEYSKSKKFLLHMIDCLNKLPKNSILRTTTHEGIIKLIERNPRVHIVDIRKTRFKHSFDLLSLILSRLEIKSIKGLFKPSDCYKIKFYIK